MNKLRTVKLMKLAKQAAYYLHIVQTIIKTVSFSKLFITLMIRDCLNFLSKLHLLEQVGCLTNGQRS